MEKEKQDSRTKRLNMRKFFAALCAVIITMAQCMLLWPAVAQQAQGAAAGADLSVRVQYFGERGDMIREVASFSRSDLQAMGAQKWYYSNVTNAGTVMSMAAYGPEVLTIIESAGIDPASVMNVTFRTTDGYTRNFTIGRHLSGGRYYYPLLSQGYERHDDGDKLMPLEGSLSEGYEVPSILALEFGSTKEPGAIAEELSMSTSRTYRFCMGQTPLTEGQWSRPGENGDVSSLDSVHSIYGMDVTLSGSPVSGIGIDPVKSKLKVGSVTKLTVNIEGDPLFAEDFSKATGRLKWSSSDTEIAKVDQSGNVTILKAGTVTITVTAENGMSASVTINGTGKAKSEKQSVSASSQTQKPAATSAAKASQKDAKAKDPADTPKKTVRMREISLGEKVEPDPPKETDQHAMEEDTSALEEQKPYSKGTAAGASIAAIAACGAGGIHRFRRFRQIGKR